LVKGLKQIKYAGVAGPIDFTRSFSGNWAKAIITKPFLSTTSQN